jgi:hypothetical protein
LKQYKLHLFISAITIFSIGLGYGLSPSNTIPLLFNVPFESIDSSHILKVTMGLYLGFASYLFYCMLQPKQWYHDTLTIVLFMSALAIGRIHSIAIDGKPSTPFLIGLAVEITLALLGIINLKKKTTTKYALHHL